MRICLQLALHPYPRSTIAWVGLPSCVSPLLDYYQLGSCAPSAIASQLQTLSIIDSSRSVYCGYWNINQLSIDYACRPRLRTRLTLSGLAWLRNPWSFGGRVSHPSFATHVYILTCVTSTAGFLRRFTSYTTLSYPSTLLDLATGIVCE